MVLQKRLDCGFNGYQVPPTPRAARSVRRRCLFKRKADDRQMCAFDLLATVAGKLLLEGESSPPPPLLDSFSKTEQLVEGSAEKEEKTETNPVEEKSCDQDSYEMNFLFPDLVTKNPNAILSHNGPISRPASGITTSNCSEKNCAAENLANDDCKLQLGIFTPAVNLDSSACRIFSDSGCEHEIRKHIKMESSIPPNSSTCNGLDFYHPVACEKKPSRLVKSVDGEKILFCRDHSPCGSTLVKRNNIKLVCRDNNSSGFTEPRIRIKAFRPSPRIGDSKIRKLLAPRPYKVTLPVKDDERYSADTERHENVSSKRSFKRQRSPRDYPFKKRKFYECSSMSNSDECNSGDTPGSGLTLSRQVIKTQNSAAGERASFHASNPQVKLKIRSLRVPELVIEIPETATVGSLKKTVMEAVNAILGSGLRVGVLRQGKMIRDDNITLLQTGISQDNEMDTLGFTLEPCISQAPLQSFPDNQPRQLLHNDHQSLARYPPTRGVGRNGVHRGKFNSLPDHAGNHFNNFGECEHESVLSPPDLSLQKPAAQLKALVPVRKMEPDVLAMVPLKKSKRSDFAQRRIRRPFAVSEVEALVQAVEKLGTGRWRDVKLRAFDSAKHRTYVDLKDKWKTLVHTARISPQQRRGEPVPQELLDRVLATHAYWSQQQAKHHLKSQLNTSLL